VVTAQTEGDAGATLVAAIVLKKEAALDVQALIAHQSRTLPPHMVARKIFALDTLPRTASGKVDRRQLSLPLDSPKDKPAAPPRDPLERQLVSIWQDGFHTSSIGIEDDFFELGGHSLLALRIFSEIEAKLGCRMMLSVLFQAPTIRQLAEYIRRERLVK
jgi:acyl carrier protein